MVRPYALKWLKKNKKKRKTEANNAAAEETEQVEVAGQEGDGEETEEEMDERKRKVATSRDDEGKVSKAEETAEEPELILPGLPLAPRAEQGNKPSVIFILEKACLRIGKVGKKEQLLTADEHTHFLKRQNLNPGDFRPDILHQAMLAILDRPLTKAGRLQALYVKTDDGELIDVKPNVRLPRTFKRFSGLMYQLKSEKRIHASGKRENLFRMIKNPVTRHLPVNARKIGLSYSSERLVKMPNYVAGINDDTPIVFVVGSMAHGKIDADYIDDFISVSEYPLSAACCINRICEALEQKWNVL